MVEMTKQQIILITLFSLSVGNAFGQINVEVQNDLDVYIQQLEDFKKVIEESLEIDFKIFILSLVISISAVIGTIVTAYYLRKQVNYSERESELRSEPWLAIEGLRPSQVMLIDGGILFYDKWQDIPKENRPAMKFVRMEFIIKNVGNGVAVNLSKLKITQDERFDRTLFENKKVLSMHTILAPNQNVYVNFDILSKRWYELEEKNLFAGLLVTYNGLKGTKRTGVIFGIKRGINFYVDSWI